MSICAGCDRPIRTNYTYCEQCWEEIVATRRYRAAYRGSFSASASTTLVQFALVVAFVVSVAAIAHHLWG
jgi:hypothetical protein